MRTYCIELYSVLCSDLNGKEMQTRGDICIRIADFTLLYNRNQHSTVKQLYSNKSKKKKKKQNKTDKYWIDQGSIFCANLYQVEERGK